MADEVFVLGTIVPPSAASPGAKMVVVALMGFAGLMVTGAEAVVGVVVVVVAVIISFSGVLRMPIRRPMRRSLFIASSSISLKHIAKNERPIAT